MSGNQQYFKYYISSDFTIINYEYTIEDFIEAITKVQELLPIMKFDKLIGRFSTDSTSEQEKQCVEALLAINPSDLAGNKSVGFSRQYLKCNSYL